MATASETTSQHESQSPPLSSTAPPKAPPSSTPPSYPHWHDVVSGGVAGLGARAVTAPLDLIKIRRQLQTQTSPTATPASSHFGHGAASSAVTSAARSSLGGEWNIFHHLCSIAEKEGGVRSLFRGNVAASYLWVGYSVSQFWIYGHASEFLRQKCAPWDADSVNATDQSVKVSGAISFTAGAISGLCATIITYPFDLCRTIFAARGLFPVATSNVTWSNRTARLASARQRRYTQCLPPNTLLEFARHLYQQKGWRGFYAGCAPGFVQIVPYMGISFAVHDVLVMLTESSDSRVSGVAGMGAGAVSKLLVYPFDTVKKRLQAQAFYGASQGNITCTPALPKRQSMYSNRPKIVGVLRKQTTPVVHYEGMVDCFQKIAQQEGMVALYKGLLPSLLKSSVSTGASFWLFTLSKNILQSIHDANS